MSAAASSSSGAVAPASPVARSLVTPLTAKFVLALVNGLVKSVFYGDASLTVAYLQEQLFAGQKTEADQQVALIESVRDALVQAASENWSVEGVTQHFRQGGLTADQTEAVAAVWKKESKKIHDLLVQSSSFSTPRFGALNWRVDVQSHSRHVQEMSVPTAIIQIDTKSTIATSPITSIVRDEQLQFEVDRASVANVLLELEKIEALLVTAAQ